MKIVVVGGQAHKVGKTSVVTGLIRGLRSRGWTAVKISRHRTRLAHGDDRSTRRAAPPRGFILREERKASITTDTGRFLLAGAKRALWLRARSASLAQAVGTLLEKLQGERNVIIESSSMLGLLKPTVGVVVLDSARREFKANVRRTLAQADAIVRVETGGGTSCPSLPIPSGIAVFPVTRQDYFNPELCRFVRRKLRHSTGSRPVVWAANAERSRRVGAQQS